MTRQKSKDAGEASPTKSAAVPTADERQQQVGEAHEGIRGTARRVKRETGYSGSMATVDIAQEVSAELLARIKDGRLDEGLVIGSKEFHGYVRAMVKNLIVSSIRAPRNRDRAHVEEVPDTADLAFSEEAVDAKRAMAKEQQAAKIAEERAAKALNAFFEGRGTLAARYSDAQRQQMALVLHLHTKEGMSADAIVKAGVLTPPVPRTTINNWLRLMETKVMVEYQAADAAAQTDAKA